MAAGTISCAKFSQYLIRKTEHLDVELLKTVLPTDELMGMVETGPFPAMDGVSHEFDRLERAVPDLSGAWQRVTSDGCTGKPCDPDEKAIGFGSTRDSYYLERKSYKTQLFCFDLIMTADRAVEQFAQMLFNLRQATIQINSDWIRVNLLKIAGKKWLASSTMADFTYTWNADQTELTPSALPTSKLTPTMLSRRVQPQINRGAMGQRPQGTDMSLELITDMDTLYQMGQGNAQIQDFWRFQSFPTATKEFYSYGWAGKIGNYNVKADLFPMRFMPKDGSPGVLVRVWPFKTVAATLGIKSVDNEDYHRAPYQITFIHHRKAMKHLTLNQEQVNPNMPFLKRDLGGKWQWVMDNLGADENGCVIENKRRNKGQFIADFVFSAKPQYVEWEEAILHLREPMCVQTIGLCDSTATSSYPTGNYNSANADCTRVFVFTPVKNASDQYQVAADTITCNGQTIDHAAIAGAASLAALVTSLNSVAGSLGTWAVVDGSTTNIQLTGNGCLSVNVPFVTP